MDLNLHPEGHDHHDDRHYAAHVDDAGRSRARTTALRPVAAPCGSGWYHDAAIEAAQQLAIEARCNPYG